MEKKWGDWERNGSVAAMPNPKTSAPIGPQLALIESWPEPAPPLEQPATSAIADAGPPPPTLEQLSKERGILRGQHPSCQGVTMVSFSAAVRSSAAAPVFGVGKERIVATAIWQPDATALDPPAPAVFLYSAQAVHTAAMTSGGTEMTWRSCKDKLRKWIKANRGGFWMPPDREPKAGSVVADHVLLNSVTACHILVECGKPYTLNPKPYTLNPKLSTLNPELSDTQKSP